jgi:hypothetical protein
MYRRFYPECLALFLISLFYLAGPFLDLALHICGGITELAQRPAHGAGHFRHALAAEKKQDEEQDHEQLATTDIEKEQYRHSAPKIGSPAEAGLHK